MQYTVQIIRGQSRAYYPPLSFADSYVLSQSLDDLGTTWDECLGRTRWSSPLDLTTYLYYFTSGCALLLHNHMSFQNILWSHDLITWYDYLIPMLFISCPCCTIWCWRSNVQTCGKLFPFWGSHNIWEDIHI